MVPPVTATIQLFIFLILIYLAYRFYWIYIVEKNFIAKFFSLLFALFGLIYLILGLPALFLTENQAVWRVAVILTCLLQVLSAGILGYIIFYLSFPRISPRWGFLLSLLEMALVFPTLVYPSAYSFGAYGVVILKINPLVGVLRYIGILIFIIPAGLVFIREAISAKDRRIKIRAFSLGIGFIGFTAVYFFDFIMANIFKFNPVFGDLFLGSCFLILLLMLILTPKILSRSESKSSQAIS